MESEPRKIFIIGDSQLGKISGETLSRYRHSVTVKQMPSARIARMKNAKIEEDTYLVIVHAETCNIQMQADPETWQKRLFLHYAM